METKKTTARGRSKENTAQETAENTEMKIPTQEGAEQAQAVTEAPTPATIQEGGKDAPSAAQADEVSALREMVEQLRRELAEAKQPQVVQMVSQSSEKVVMRFQAEVADDNVAVFGPNGLYGQVTGKRGTVVVPKDEWSRFYNESVRRMIDRRWLVVLSGLTEEERVMFHCDYRPGELLDEQAFAKLLDLGKDLLGLFPQLCPYHQEMVGRAFWDAWEAGDPRAQDRDLVAALNELSKQAAESGAEGTYPKGVFRPVLEAMNARDLKD